MRASSARIRGEKVEGGRGASDGWGVVVWVAGRSEVRREAIWERVSGVGSGSMSVGFRVSAVPGGGERWGGGGTWEGVVGFGY